MSRRKIKQLLSGDEAVAYGAYDAGVRIATAYPGTPSTEIVETFSGLPEVYAEWCPNEKVAFEVAIGSCLAGARTLVSMKHVGLNVAADPFFTASYVGVNGGLLVVSADDPGMHSSQNEQDNRHYAVAAKVPMLEPSDSQEAYDFARLALEISETFDTPCLLRITTRVAHSKTVVVRRPADRKGTKPASGFRKNPSKYVMVPIFARQRHEEVEQRLKRLLAYSESTPLNVARPGSRNLGIIASGVAYTHAKEVCPEASFLKIGMSHPLPAAKIRAFARGLRRIVVVEELDPFLENQIRALGIPVEGKSLFPICGELTPHLVRQGLRRATGSPPRVALSEERQRRALPPRPPALCPGCPHSATFYTLKKLKLDVMGDIGCYTLSVAPPLETMDACVCMGASIGMAHGMERALGDRINSRTVAVIGDGTFLHSGITALLNVAYNKGRSTTIVLDNRTTAMTGLQDHPGTGRTLQGDPSPAVDFEALGRALGIESVRIVDPYDLKGLEAALREEIQAPRSSLIIARRPCLLLKKGERPPARTVNADACVGCGLCLRIGCPALSEADGGKARIDPLICNGCPICGQVCKAGAIREARTP